ncbi:Pre-mRNA leakage protein 1 [Nakaseomyces bracarensis]|uniref:Pre-mRNA leakage protein 1 n=1 Tax=Nakaseomyces bracarensis TaxID=273131 RepID=A0ABR4NQL1_9SACH
MRSNRGAHSRGSSRYNGSKNRYKRANEGSRYNGANKRPHVEKKPLLPIFTSSGLLELDSNNKNGILLKHVEPIEGVSPFKFYSTNPNSEPINYRGMLFEGSSKDPIKTYDLNDRSCYLIGRKDEESPEDDIADISIPEETCSQQHCVIQFRRKNESLVPFIIDLESSNGTTLNGIRIPAARYVELKTGDVIKFTIDERDSIYELVFVYG